LFARYVATTIDGMKMTEGSFQATIRPDVLPETTLRVTLENGFLRVSLQTASAAALGLLQNAQPQLENLLFGGRRSARRGCVEIVDRRIFQADTEDAESQDEGIL
jgi:hypothetical protein